MTRSQDHDSSSVAVDERLQRLSPRQRTIAERYAEGLTYKHIAAELFIAPATVRNHLATIYRELGIGNKADLIGLMTIAADAERTEVFAESAPEPVGQLAGKLLNSDDYVLKPWLQALSLGQYVETFAANAIDWQTLPTLSDHDLRIIGVKPIGHRKTLLQAMAKLAEETDKASLGATESPPTSAQPERRQLTVMFCDLVDSTALAERFDPEELVPLIRAFQDACAREVARFEGHIARYLGTGILIYFGWPKAHEDEVERALRAGLAIVDAVARRKLGNIQLQTQVGIATGLVVVGEAIGEGLAQEPSAVGEAPNLAAQLQSMAEPGSVIIASSTRKLCGERFELVDLGVQPVAGMSVPVHAYAVQNVRVLESRFNEAHQTSELGAMVGRQHELGLLCECWQQATVGAGQLVMLSGDAGIGKSRIVRALSDTLMAEDHCHINYQCSPYHSDSTLYPVLFLTLFHRRFLRVNWVR